MVKHYIVNNKPVLFYTIGEVAQNIGRGHLTVRKWERDGVLPPASYRSENNFRLYTQEQVDIVKKLVKKYRVKQGRRIPQEFINELHKAFNELTLTKEET